MVIKIVNDELFDSQQTEVSFPDADTIQIKYLDNGRPERLVAIGKHPEDFFLQGFGFKIIG